MIGVSTGVTYASCSVCNGSHPTGVSGCPFVKEIEYYPNGSIKRIVKRTDVEPVATPPPAPPVIPESPNKSGCPNGPGPCYCTGACRGARRGRVGGGWCGTGDLEGSVYRGSGARRDYW